MKITRLTFVLLLACLSPLHGEERNAEELFFKANVLAAQESYSAAIPLYETALVKGPSPNLHYNLGNAYYRAAEWGRARLHWEKALAMEPRHTSARHNLRVLLREQGLPESPSGPGARLAGLLSFHHWIWVASLGFWVLVGALAAACWRKLKGFFALAGVGAAGMLTSLVAVWFMEPGFSDAILLDEEASLRLAPAPASPVAAAVRSPQRVRVQESYGDFLRVRLESGQEGFVESEKLEKIRE